MSANTFLPPSPVVPQFLVIEDITTTSPMIITVTTDNDYVVGQLVHLSVPETYGMFQADQLTGTIIAVDDTNLIFTVDINATQFDTFVAPPNFTEKPATIAPAGSRNIYNSTTVPFHSQGNVGN